MPAVSFLKRKDESGLINVNGMVVLSVVMIDFAVLVLFTNRIKDPLTAVSEDGLKELSFTDM